MLKQVVSARVSPDDKLAQYGPFPPPPHPPTVALPWTRVCVRGRGCKGAHIRTEAGTQRHASTHLCLQSGSRAVGQSGSRAVRQSYNRADSRAAGRAGGAGEGSLMFWPTRPAALRDTNNVAKTAACGASNKVQTPTNTRPQSHLFHNKTTCNRTGRGGPEGGGGGACNEQRGRRSSPRTTAEAEPRPHGLLRAAPPLSSGAHRNRMSPAAQRSAVCRSVIVPFTRLRRTGGGVTDGGCTGPMRVSPPFPFGGAAVPRRRPLRPPRRWSGGCAEQTLSRDSDEDVNPPNICTAPYPPPPSAPPLSPPRNTPSVAPAPGHGPGIRLVLPRGVAWASGCGARGGSARGGHRRVLFGGGGLACGTLGRCDAPLPDPGAAAPPQRLRCGSPPPPLGCPGPHTEGGSSEAAVRAARHAPGGCALGPRGGGGAAGPVPLYATHPPSPPPRGF